MALYGHIGIVSEEGIVVRCQLRCLTLSHVVSKGGGRLSHRLNGEEHILTLTCEAGHVSKVVLRHLLRLTGLDIDTKEIRRAVIRGNETELLATGTPAQLLRVVLVVLGDKDLLPALHIHDEDPREVRLTAVMLHAEPGELGPVGRESRVGIVAHHPLCQIGRLATLEVKEINIGISRDGVFLTHLLTARVGNLLAVLSPAQLLSTAKGFGRQLKELALIKN